MEVNVSLPNVVVPVHDHSAAGEARRHAASLAERIELDTTRRGNLAIAVTELVRNMVIHAGGGQLLVLPGPGQCLDLLALDKGPGIPDVDSAMRDGYSTAGTAGIGLGAVQRLADEFDIHAPPGSGTAVFCRFGAAGPADMAAQVGGLSIAQRGEAVCGDAWASRLHPGRIILMVADGLGHGQQAADASQEAVRVFLEHPDLSPPEVLELAHGALRKTRGAAMAICEWNLGQQTLLFTGIGNIAGMILTGDASRSLVSHNGIVGHEMRKIREFSYPCPTGSLVIMNSDGLISQWKVEPSTGLAVRHPALIAGVLHRDYARGRDDVTVVAARQSPGRGAKNP
jgi:anti-sigma regulatory factor (Ser/Thr protein kinase)